MSKHDTTKQRVLSGTANANIQFDDLCALFRHLGFRERINSSHHIYSKPGIREIANFQPGRDGKAKSYQVKQAKYIILNYKL